MLDRHTRREIRGGFFWYGFRWYIVIIVVLLLTGWALFALDVLTSDARGRGDAIKTKNSGTNRIAAQERFEDRYADIEAAGQRVALTARNAKANPDDYTAQVQATGAITYCQQAVADYNADARKYTAAQFRASDLPSRIDATDACKENLT